MLGLIGLIPKLLTVKKVADILEVSVRTIHSMVRKKDVESVKINGRRLIKETEVKRLIKTNTEKRELSVSKIAYSIGPLTIKLELLWHK